ncbi:MAG TPA: hypothetical protein ENJ97_06585, partial [Planctomycetes bacterium]|nr:hypothetical protein [Planctomycetota bacterium]
MKIWVRAGGVTLGVLAFLAWNLGWFSSSGGGGIPPGKPGVLHAQEKPGKSQGKPARTTGAPQAPKQNKPKPPASKPSRKKAVALL